MLIDLRSDTVTKPTPAMLEAMMQAEVGDDVFDEDPSIKKLEKRAAQMLGMEAALFCPSGTMTNQIALRILTQPQDQVICDKRSHIYNYEGGGAASNSGLTFRLVDGESGLLTPEHILENINPDDIHFPVTRLVSLENTMNKGGGSYYQLPDIEAISHVCKENQLALHLDGARLFNALAETGENPQLYGKYFDTISLCLSKGLGAPVGSLILGSKAHIKQAKRVRKVFGGGMRQAGYLAAAGLYALEHHVKRLGEDHRKARVMGAILEKLPFVDELLPVRTNILVFKLREDISPRKFLAYLADYQLRAVHFGGQYIRFVTHLDFTDEMLERSLKILKTLRF